MDEQEYGIFDAMIDKIKELWYDKKQVFVIPAAIIVLIVVICLCIPNKPEPPQFAGSVAEGFDSERIFTYANSKFELAMRVADVTTYNSKRETEYSSLEYNSEIQHLRKYLYMDFVIGNKSGNPIDLSANGGGGIFLGYENKEEFSAVGGYLYNEASDKYDGNYELAIAPDETREIRLRFSVNPQFYTDYDTVFFCNEFTYDDKDIKYEVAGVGPPYQRIEFENSSYLPELIPGEDKQPDVQTQAQTAAYVSYKYPKKVYSADSSALSDFNSTAQGVYQLSVEINGDSDDCLQVSESGYSNTIANDAITGPIPEITYSGSELENIRVCFKIEPLLQKNTNGKYAEYSEEFEGIKRFNVFHYSEDINMNVPIETSFDLENNIVYADLNEDGTYCIMDMELWFESLGIQPSEAVE